MEDDRKKEGVHSSHLKVRFSDASTFDLICDDCGATDNPMGVRGPDPNGNLANPCPKNS